MHRLRTFGLVDLRDADGRELLPATGDTIPLALVVHLATARPPGARRRDDLGALLWPEETIGRQRDALDAVLDIVRTALGDAAIVDVGRSSVALDPARCWCDVSAFRGS